MKMFRLLMLLMVLMLFNGVPAQSAGTTSFEFLRTQYSPRGAALGGNLLAVKEDVNAALYNPASLSGFTERQWSVNYVDHLLDFKGGYLAYTQPVKKLGTLSGSIIYFNYGTFEETNEFGDRTGNTFSAAEMALSVGLSNTLGEGFDYGLSAKFIYSSIEKYNASAVAMDAGLMYTSEKLDGLRIGISLLNLGATLDNYTSQKEKLPLMLQVGFAKRLAHLPLVLSGSFQDLAASEEDFWNRFKRFSLGGEFDVSEKVKLRLGYMNEVNQSVKPLSRNIFGGISAGLGIYWRKFRLDYAYSSFGELGSQNRLGITGTF